MRVLVLGGTGAIGSRLCPALAAGGHDVVVTSRRPRQSVTPGLAYTFGDAKDLSFFDGLLKRDWDAVVDFMIWTTAEFRERYRTILDSTDHYVFLSSYRVYADSPIITEQSPRLLDTCEDAAYLASDEYAIAKARCEDLLESSGVSNWSIVRPAITYDGPAGRMQLGTYEARDWLWRALHSIPIPFPEDMLSKQATMTWSGDVSRMITGLLERHECRGQTYIASTSEHMSWGDVASAYQEVVPFELVPCGLDEFVQAKAGEAQIRFDRMYDRVIDNSKVLEATNLRQADFLPMSVGLKEQLTELLNIGQTTGVSVNLQAKLDRLCGRFSSLVHIIRNRGSIQVLPRYMYYRLLD